MNYKIRRKEATRTKDETVAREANARIGEQHEAIPTVTGDYLVTRELIHEREIILRWSHGSEILISS